MQHMEKMIIKYTDEEYTMIITENERWLPEGVAEEM